MPHVSLILLGPRLNIYSHPLYVLKINLISRQPHPLHVLTIGLPTRPKHHPLCRYYKLSHDTTFALCMCSSFKNEVTSLSLCNENRLNHETITYALCDDNIDYYIVFFISHPLSALGHDISPIANRLKG
jgi:hypothetical protein